MEEILALEVIDEAHKAGLAVLWVNSVFDLRFDGSLSKSERLAGWVPKLQLATSGHRPLAKDLQKLLRAS